MPNSLLTVIFIVWLIVPGTFLKRFYFQGYFTKQFGSGDFADRIITSVFWGMLIQVVTFTIFSKYKGIEYKDIRTQVETTYSSFVDNKVPDLSGIDSMLLLIYIITSLVIAVCAGTLAHKLVRLFKLDTRFLVLRFSNQWHYYLMGDIASLSGHTSSDKKGKVISTQADIIFKDGKEKPKLLQGFVKDYFISSKSGELESIIITHAKRWCKKDGTFKSIPGDALLVPYSNIMDMNFTYNVKAVDYLKRKKRLDAVNIVLFTVGLAFCLIFPWTRDVDFKRSFTGMLFMGLTMLFTTGLIEVIFSPPPHKLPSNESSVDQVPGVAGPKNKDQKLFDILFALLVVVTFTLMSIWVLR